MQIEGEVLRRQRMAVRPLHPLPQRDGHRAPAVAELGALGEVREIQPHLRPDAIRALILIEEVHVRLEERRRAAVYADALERLDDDRVVGKALLHRRQLTRGHLRVQHR